MRFAAFFLSFFLSLVIMFCGGAGLVKKAEEPKDGTKTTDKAGDDSGKAYKEVRDAEGEKTSKPKKANGDKKAAEKVMPSTVEMKKEKARGAGGIMDERHAKREPDKAPKRETPSTSGLKAGFSDDNRQFNYFVNFLKKYGKDAANYPINIEERIILKVADINKKPVANAEVSVYAGKNLIASGKTYADGTFLFFPSEYDKNIGAFRADIAVLQKKKSVVIDRQGPREVAVGIDSQRNVPANVPLDILFIMDTTGSMGEEIARLKSTIEIINMNLASLSAKPKIRFGMVLYKDRGDEYVTNVIPLTEDLEEFQKSLELVNASGGGDEPEDLQSALDDAMHKIKWNRDGIRLGFIITDAPSHLEYGQEYTYVKAVKDARKNGIKIFSVGTGGLNLSGEYILRQISQYTYAKYIFLTYGEKGESAGGREGSVSHHTGTNFTADKLESIIIRFTKEELAFLTDKPLESGEEFIQAVKIEDEKNEETLKKLFDMSITQLVDYSTINIGSGTTASIIPFSSVDKNLKVNAEYFTEQMGFSLSRNKTFTLVERKDMQKILKELELQMTGIIQDEGAVKVGKLIGAKMIIAGKLYPKDGNYEIFLKLLRVETGEVLSVNKLRVDKKLGLLK